MRRLHTVTNDGSLGAAVPIQGFVVKFDPTLYAETSLAILTPDPPSSEWDELILASGVGVAAAYDAFALGDGIAPGSSMSEFAVAFEWLGTGAPSAQPFEIYDADTFEVIASGLTTAVPVPGALALILPSALVLIAAARRRR